MEHSFGIWKVPGQAALTIRVQDRATLQAQSGLKRRILSTKGLRQVPQEENGKFARRNASNRGHGRIV